jgi:hypothetical protein
MSWYRLIDFWTPMVFSPKVTPDPASAAQLDEKFELAIKKLKQESQRGQPKTVVTPL